MGVSAEAAREDGAVRGGEGQSCHATGGGCEVGCGLLRYVEWDSLGPAMLSRSVMKQVDVPERLCS